MCLPVSSWENIIKIQNRNGDSTDYDMKQLLHIERAGWVLTSNALTSAKDLKLHDPPNELMSLSNDQFIHIIKEN